MAWAPMVEKGLINTDGWGKANKDHHKDIHGSDAIARNDQGRAGDVVSTVTDYRPTCECGVTEHEPGIVLDIFGGSGTTGMVAKQLDRRWVIMDISAPYLKEQAKVRTGYDDGN